MSVMPAERPAIDYDQRAASYARHRGIHEGVLRDLMATGAIYAETRLLDVGCGTGNYAAALRTITECQVSGIEPSAEMRTHAAGATEWEALVAGRAEQLPFPDQTFNMVMTTDVIHHVTDRKAYFRETARVLVPGGKIATVTDSHADLARRRPLTTYFPETLDVEVERYPDVSVLTAEMSTAGFAEIRLVEVMLDYKLIDIGPYRDRAFSSLHLIAEEAFQRGVARMEQDLRQGPIPARSLYTVIWGELSRP